VTDDNESARQKGLTGLPSSWFRHLTIQLAGCSWSRAKYKVRAEENRLRQVSLTRPGA
jgi:hypothetical protein